MDAEQCCCSKPEQTPGEHCLIQTSSSTVNYWVFQPLVLIFSFYLPLFFFLAKTVMLYEMVKLQRKTPNIQLHLKFHASHITPVGTNKLFFTVRVWEGKRHTLYTLPLEVLEGFSTFECRSKSDPKLFSQDDRLWDIFLKKIFSTMVNSQTATSMRY